jgi:NTP pyrophosphatase (non-canonical NTP hydrolase)
MDVLAIQATLRAFNKDRDWDRYHTPKNLSMALAGEAAELLEIFQWMTPDESVAVRDVPHLKHDVEEEIGDVVNYVLRIADVLDIDVEQAVLNKIKKNALKYPPDGSNTPRSKRDVRHE